MKKPKRCRALIAVLALMLVLGNTLPAFASHLSGMDPAVYTLDADFDDGVMVNVIHDPSDQLQLDDTIEAFNFIWVAVSSKGTVVKIDTRSGQILGEYRTTPENSNAHNPSRTTVDKNGNVWVTNRNETVYVPTGTISASNPVTPPTNRHMGSVIQIGLVENGQCQDRNNNGVIDTSTGLGDVKGWKNSGGQDTLGGVSTAEDECIICRTLVNSTGTRHVSVNANNDIWVSGTGSRDFDLIDGQTKKIVRQESSVGYGGYGGLIDGNGVIWSARTLLRWDTANPLSGPNGGNWTGYAHDSYGLGIDSQGNVWNTALNGNVIRKFAPDGSLLGVFSHGFKNAQGCVAGAADHVWVAHSLLSRPVNTVGHILNDGTYIGNVTLDTTTNDVGPTGVAVDGDGKIWATGYYSGKVYRIDPAAGPVGADGVTPVGQVDYTSVNLGGNLYNYSDMTGSTLIGAPDEGTWTVIHDSNIVGQEWGEITWTADEPGDSSIVVSAASSTDGSSFSAEESVSPGVDLTVPDGQYLRVTVKFTRSTNSDADNDGVNDSPVLYDLTISGANQPPDCSEARASVEILWPPNHKFVPVSIEGVTDPDDDDVTIVIDGIYQDEPTDTYGDGKHAPDGMGVGGDTAMVRAERSGNRSDKKGKKDLGNGRVYTIFFTATDENGESCSGHVTVGVPHDQGRHNTPVNDGALYDSTQ